MGMDLRLDNIISVGDRVVNLYLNLIINVIECLVICELCQEDTLQEDHALWLARTKHHEKNLMFGKFGFCGKCI